MTIQLRTHITFWVIIFALLVAVFSGVFHSFTLSFYFMCMLLPVAFGTACTFNFYLVPRFWLRKRYGKFLLYFLYLLVVSTYLELWVMVGSLTLLANFNYNNLNPIIGNIFILGIVLYFVVFLNAFLLLTKRSFSIERKKDLLRAEKSKSEKGYITVRVNRRQAKINYEDIAFIESTGDYVKIVSRSGNTILTHERISHLDKKLPVPFLRIHRSFIVNSQKVDYFSKTELQINNHTLPISRTYKKEVTNQLARENG